MVDGRTATDGQTPTRWVYYKLTFKPNCSGELKIVHVVLLTLQ